MNSAEAAQLFNNVMERHSRAMRIVPSDLSFGEKCVILRSGGSGDGVAEQLFNEMFPPSPPGTYHHYTTYGGFKGIISSGCLRLYNLHKRFKSGEFRTFCQDHGLDGYLGIGGADEPYFELMRDLFYTSFVNEDAADSQEHWTKFANGGEGVRLTIDVSFPRSYPNFRRLAYQAPDCYPIFRDLQTVFRERGWYFVNEGLSRMGGFYQRKDFDSQFEHRLLVKRFQEPSSAFPFEAKKEGKGAIEYIEVDLNSDVNRWFTIRLRSVMVGRGASRTNVERYLEQHPPFDSLPLLDSETHP